MCVATEGRIGRLICALSIPERLRLIHRESPGRYRRSSGKKEAYLEWLFSHLPASLVASCELQSVTRRMREIISYA